MYRLRVVPPCRFLVQASRLLHQLRRKEDVRLRGRPRRSSDPARASAPMGVDRAPWPSRQAGVRSSPDERGPAAVHQSRVGLAPATGAAGRCSRRAQDRRGNGHPTIQLGCGPERSLSRPVLGRRIQLSARSQARVPSHPRAHRRGRGARGGHRLPAGRTCARTREPDAAQRRFIESAPVLAAVAQASARGVVATGPRRDRCIIRIRGAPADVDAFVMGRLCAQVEGFNLQAATRVAASDRAGLERMARYLARPPIATDRLSQLDDGRLELRLKRAWRDGTTALLFTPHELIERLVAIVPRPRAHLTRYFGVLAPSFAARSGIVPAETATAAAPPAPRTPPPDEASKRRRPGRVPWASLIWRVFLNDVLECGRCGGRMEIIAAVTSTEAVTRILDHLELPFAAPAFHSARPPPQTELPFASGGFEPTHRPPTDSSPTHRRPTTSPPDTVPGPTTAAHPRGAWEGTSLLRRRRGPCFPRPKGRPLQLT